MSTVTYFMTTVTGNVEIKKKQQKISMILESKKIPFDAVDIAADSNAKARMRELAADSTALPPQLANGDQYCGNFDAFEDAVEQGTLNEFLKI